MAIETPGYTVLKKSGQIELRRYKGYITASVEVVSDSYNSASNQAFGILANFIFGNNTKQAKLAMTAPVTANKLDSKTYIVSFTMPSAYNLASLPKPNNDVVVIKQTFAHKAVVISFSGYTTESKIERMSTELRAWSNKNMIRIVGEPTLSRYDPPWKPGFIRKNEVSYLVE